MTAQRRARRDGEDYQAMKDALTVRDASQRSQEPRSGVLGVGVVSEVTSAQTGASWQCSVRYPPSTNALYATVNGRRVKTREAREFADVVGSVGAVMAATFGIPEPPYRLTIELWAPDNRRRDADNGVKCLQDALLAATERDDADVVVLHVVKRGVDRLNPRAEVTLEHAAERRDDGSER